MFTKILLIFPLLMTLPPIEAKWNTHSRESLTIKVNFEDELVNRCLDSGLELRYEYKIQVCRKSKHLFRNCGDIVTNIRSVKRDSIDETFRAALDQLGDEKPAEKRTLFSLEDALSTVSSIGNLRPASFKEDNLKSATLRARVQLICKGEHSKTFTRITQFLTFGLLDIRGPDTGWVDFVLGD